MDKSPIGSASSRPVLWWALLALTLGLTVALQAVDAPLKTAAARQGIISYEFAGTVPAAQAMLDSWDENARAHAGFSLGLDYLYMPVYALTIGLACAWAGRVLAARWRGWRVVGLVLGIGLAPAALADATENFALTRMLFGGVAAPWPAVARGCATGKFALISIGFIFALVGLGFWIAGVKRPLPEHA